jgi:hypothetical protein
MTGYPPGQPLRCGERAARLVPLHWSPTYTNDGDVLDGRHGCVADCGGRILLQVESCVVAKLGGSKRVCCQSKYQEQVDGNGVDHAASGDVTGAGLKEYIMSGGAQLRHHSDRHVARDVIQAVVAGCWFHHGLRQLMVS